MSTLTKRTGIVSSEVSSDSNSTTIPQTPTANAAQQRGRVPTSVVLKLILFSVLILVGPIATYFGTLNKLFNGMDSVIDPNGHEIIELTISGVGNANYAAAASVIVANLVIFGYVIVAIIEDKDTFGESGPVSDDRGKKSK
ncbi:hypothetical protein BKA69DRAFT_1034989 [Paraphysoderma sedebokerense]|nr:hypothetical protein BKA69DRAFT_1034989 [Paraphysoderma sedebokerense]